MERQSNLFHTTVRHSVFYSLVKLIYQCLWQFLDNIFQRFLFIILVQTINEALLFTEHVSKNVYTARGARRFDAHINAHALNLIGLIKIK